MDKKSKVKLSISVMAHPSRSKFFSYLTNKLGDVPFSIDDDHRGVWANCRHAWELRDPSADYHVVIQDDAIVCNNFKQKAEEFLGRFHHFGEGGRIDPRTKAFSFYYGNRMSDRDLARKGLEKGYAVRETPTWGVAICLPNEIVPEMISYCDNLSHIRQDDVRIGRFLKQAGIKVWYPLPSLIDHRVEIESLVKDPGRNRRAIFFIDDPKRL